jgi:heme/copper-type cytochrome/quinol oxidase subunit 2
MRISFAKGCKLMSTLWLIVALPVSGMIVYFAGRYRAVAHGQRLRA